MVGAFLCPDDKQSVSAERLHLTSIIRFHAVHKSLLAANAFSVAGATDA